MYLTWDTFVDGVTSQSVMSVDGEEILGKALVKTRVSSWKQEEREWMKDDLAVHSKYLKQLMEMIIC